MKRATFLSAAAAALVADPTLAGSASAAFRIDVHHHLMPPFFGDAVRRKIEGPLAGWTPDRSFADMDPAGVAVAILSMPRTPSISLAGIARRVNEYSASLRQTYPARFRFWAEVPLPDVETSIAEATYALDHLGADGIAVATSYGNKWLGDAAFAPLWDEMNRRKAVVFTHPLSNQCCANLQPGIGDQIIEFGTDTTRTLASLVFSGTAQRYPDVRFIFAHAGGTMPFLIDRFRFQARDPQYAAAVPRGVDYELQRFYYDTAQAATPEAIGALMKLVPASHVLFGTDYPYRRCTEDVTGLAGCGLHAGDLQAIARQNALTLLPLGV
jgi:predicted TIM-barrel fold metal-dependent hydrolase